MAKRKKQETFDFKEEILEYETRKTKYSSIEKDNLLSNKQIAKNIINKKIVIKCKNAKQKDFLNTIDSNEITLCIGSAGVGKSYLSIAKALELLLDQNNHYEKIYIACPIVPAEEEVGHLKGSLDEKIQPFIYSSYYLIDKIIGSDAREKLVSAKIIESVVLTFMRGVNIDNTIFVFEEAQNISPKGMKLLLSRIGYNSKFIISGDIEQCDKYRDYKQSGLYKAINNLKDIDNLSTFEFTKDDIVRNPIISKILEKLDN